MHWDVVRSVGQRKEYDGVTSSPKHDAPADRPRTLSHRIRRSFVASVGSIVFGMEDGTVSIFGVAASAPNSSAEAAGRGDRRGGRGRVDEGGHLSRRGVDQ